ncbi:MAG: Rieske 2Fe-2S domain-containing protein [Chitinispirillaceae bacterium]|nr:Rieske 2Fe-2S domain-containing protein [Chitinispirillaceae bacterium]
MHADDLSRRKFLKVSGAATLGAAAISTGMIRCATPTATDPEHGTFTFDISDAQFSGLTVVGGSAYCVLTNPDFPAIVIRTGQNELKAFSSKCTHQQCKINLPQNGISVCPCHQSRFDTSGAIISGPASNQPAYTASLSGTTLTITA